MKSTVRPAVLAGALVLATFFAFYPILSAGFTNWDDPVMVTQNARITGLSWSHWVTFFTTFTEKHYHPLVLASYAIDYKLFGLSPLAFHLTSLGIHLASTVLVFWLFQALTQNQRVAFVTAALFGFHPMHVESVAWISERKDVLYAAFFWAALLAHTYYVQRNRRSLYWLGLGFFVLSLLSKSMAVTLPAALLLVDGFLARKIDRAAILEKLPHFGLSLAFAAIAMVGHYQPGATGGGSSSSALGTIQPAFENLMFYLIKLVAPVNLAALYPEPRHLGDLPAWLFVWAPLILIVLGAAAYRVVRGSRPAIFGLLFFLVTFSPVSQILPIGLSIPADRYTYVPYVGLVFALISWLDSSLRREPNPRRQLVFNGLAAVVLVASWGATFQRVKVWHDSASLWKDSSAKYPVPRAFHNLGLDYLSKGDPATAASFFSKAIAAQPRLSAAWLNRGVAHARQGNYQAAIADYNEAERLNPKLVDTYLNRGTAYAAIGMSARALKDYSEALTLRPSYPEAWYNRGNLYLAMRRWDLAIADYTEALKSGDNFPVRLNRGNAYWSAGNWSKAFDDFTVAIQLQPRSPAPYYYRARIYAKYGQPGPARADALKARSLGRQISEQELAELSR